MAGCSPNAFYFFQGTVLFIEKLAAHLTGQLTHHKKSRKRGFFVLIVSHEVILSEAQA
jgi:hypothetical protein